MLRAGGNVEHNEVIKQYRNDILYKIFFKQTFFAAAGGTYN
jgi:hypothetical protein